MTYDSDTVIKCLAGSRSPAVARLISKEAGQFSTAEVLEIELAMYQKLPQGTNIGKMQSALRDLISARDPNHESVNKAGVAHRYPTSSNPHATGLLEAEKTYGITVQWLERALKPLGGNSPSEHASTSAFSLLATFIVAAILDFEFLHTDFIPALIEALQRGGTIPLNRAMIGISLSLWHGQQENAEARLLIARGATATLLRKLLSHKDLRVTLDRLVIPGTKPDQVAIVHAIDQQIASMESSIECGCITHLLIAAGQLSTVHILPVIGEARNREIVAHSLRPQVFKRIQRKQNDSTMQMRIPLKRLTGVRDIAEPLRNASTTHELKWLVQLRKALPKDGIDLPDLQDLASGSDIGGRRMGEFALYLSARLGPSSVNRYTLLIASRIMSRPELENCDAVEVLEEEWEEIIEQVLDEDETFRVRRYTDSPLVTGKEYSFALLKALRYFFRFLRLMKPDRPIEAVEGSIPTTGIIKVDANMMTIDEYKVALAWLSGPYGFSGRYMRSASRVVLILGYRCGLRRSEAAYLRLSDFDDGDYLHVRPWFMRRLKTANALRDLPLRVLMPDDELQEVLAFIATARARGRNCSEGALLFAKEENSRVLINFERVIGQVHCAIRTIDPSLHYHSLRHSYCNILLLKLWPSLHPVARLVFRHHPAMIASFGDSELFRQQLFGTTAIKGADLQGIALLMGHGSALVSLGHYIHVLDWYGFRNGS